MKFLFSNGEVYPKTTEYERSDYIKYVMKDHDQNKAYRVKIYHNNHGSKKGLAWAVSLLNADDESICTTKHSLKHVKEDTRGHFNSSNFSFKHPGERIVGIRGNCSKSDKDKGLFYNLQFISMCPDHK
jgi:hypothetical protein